MFYFLNNAGLDFTINGLNLVFSFYSYLLLKKMNVSRGFVLRNLMFK
mgnify:CR=1 FL=1